MKSDCKRIEPISFCEQRKYIILRRAVQQIALKKINQNKKFPNSIIFERAAKISAEAQNLKRGRKEHWNMEKQRICNIHWWKRTISVICNSMKHKYKVGYRSCRIKSFQDMYQRLTYKESTQPLAKTATPTLSAYGTTSGHKRLQYRNIFWRIRRKYEDAQ